MKESVKIISVILIAGGCALLRGPSSFAQSNQKKDDKTWTESLIDYNKYVSEKIDDTARGIDLFISRRKNSYQKNKSSITLRSFFAHYEGGEKNSSNNFDINLRLPNVEEKWALRFTSYDQNREDRGIRNQQQRLQGRERNYGAGVMLMQELGDIRTSFQPRIELKDPLQTSYTLKFESAADVKPFRIDPRFEFFADSERGVGQFVSLSTELSLQEDWSIIQFNEEQYENYQNRLQTTHGLSISKDVGKREGVNTTLSFRSFRSTESPGFHLSDFTASAGYSSEPYRRVLIYRVGPVWSFAKENHFKGKVGFTVEVDLIF